MIFCPCASFTENPDLQVDEAVRVCECGHNDDEHTDDDECGAEV
jgi:hypothetical protein